MLASATTPDKPDLKVLTIGAGFFARLHLDAWKSIDGVDLRGLADLDRDRAEEAAAGIFGPDNSVEIGTDPVAMMSTQQFDVIDIAAPPVAHADLVRKAFQSSARAVICQKPFCTSLDEARDVAAFAAADGRPLIIHENFRFMPWYRQIADVLASGRIGQVYQSTFRLRPGDGQGPDAYLARQPYFQTMKRFMVHETGIHWIDVFRFLHGEPEAVFADLRQLNPKIAGEDAGVILLRHPEGLRTVIDGNRLADHRAADARRTMGEGLIEGELATLTLDGYGRVHFRARGSETLETLPAATDDPRFGGGCVERFQTHVVRHLRDGSPLENTATEYLRNLEIEEAVYRSAETGTVVDLTRG